MASTSYNLKRMEGLGVSTALCGTNECEDQGKEVQDGRKTSTTVRCRENGWQPCEMKLDVQKCECCDGCVETLKVMEILRNVQ